MSNKGAQTNPANERVQVLSKMKVWLQPIAKARRNQKNDGLTAFRHPGSWLQPETVGDHLL
jgi:hypothetical protein